MSEERTPTKERPQLMQMRSATPRMMRSSPNTPTRSRVDSGSSSFSPSKCRPRSVSPSRPRSRVMSDTGDSHPRPRFRFPKVQHKDSASVASEGSPSACKGQPSPMAPKRSVLSLNHSSSMTPKRSGHSLFSETPRRGKSIGIVMFKGVPLSDALKMKENVELLPEYIGSEFTEDEGPDPTYVRKLTLSCQTADVDKLRRVPRELTHFNHLRELDLSGNNIQLLDGLEKLLSLVSLNLARNRLGRLDGIGAVSPQTLRYLDLSGNLISRLPPALGELAALEELDLRGNRLQALLELRHLRACAALEVLSVGANPLDRQRHWREFAVHHLPALACLDGRPVTGAQRRAAEAEFGDAAAAEAARREADARRAAERARAEEDRARALRRENEHLKAQLELKEQLLARKSRETSAVEGRLTELEARLAFDRIDHPRGPAEVAPPPAAAGAAPPPPREDPSLAAAGLLPGPGGSPEGPAAAVFPAGGRGGGGGGAAAPDAVPWDAPPGRTRFRDEQHCGAYEAGEEYAAPAAGALAPAPGLGPAGAPGPAVLGGGRPHGVGAGADARGQELLLVAEHEGAAGGATPAVEFQRLALDVTELHAGILRAQDQEQRLLQLQEARRGRLRGLRARLGGLQAAAGRVWDEFERVYAAVDPLAKAEDGDAGVYANLRRIEQLQAEAQRQQKACTLLHRRVTAVSDLIATKTAAFLEARREARGSDSGSELRASEVRPSDSRLSADFRYSESVVRLSETGSAEEEGAPQQVAREAGAAHGTSAQRLARTLAGLRDDLAGAQASQGATVHELRFREMLVRTRLPAAAFLQLEGGDGTAEGGAEEEEGLTADEFLGQPVPARLAREAPAAYAARLRGRAARAHRLQEGFAAMVEDCERELLELMGGLGQLEARRLSLEVDLARKEAAVQRLQARSLAKMLEGRPHPPATAAPPVPPAAYDAPYRPATAAGAALLARERGRSRSHSSASALAAHEAVLAAGAAQLRGDSCPPRPGRGGGAPPAGEAWRGRLPERGGGGGAGRATGRARSFDPALSGAFRPSFDPRYQRDLQAQGSFHGEIDYVDGEAVAVDGFVSGDDASSLGGVLSTGGPRRLSMLSAGNPAHPLNRAAARRPTDLVFSVPNHLQIPKPTNQGSSTDRAAGRTNPSDATHHQQQQQSGPVLGYVSNPKVSSDHQHSSLEGMSDLSQISRSPDHSRFTAESPRNPQAAAQAAYVRGLEEHLKQQQELMNAQNHKLEELTAQMQQLTASRNDQERTSPIGSQHHPPKRLATRSNFEEDMLVKENAAMPSSAEDRPSRVSVTATTGRPSNDVIIPSNAASAGTSVASGTYNQRRPRPLILKHLHDMDSQEEREGQFATATTSPAGSHEEECGAPAIKDGGGIEGKGMREVGLSRERRRQRDAAIAAKAFRKTMSATDLYNLTGGKMVTDAHLSFMKEMGTSSSRIRTPMGKRSTVSRRRKVPVGRRLRQDKLRRLSLSSSASSPGGNSPFGKQQSQQNRATLPPLTQDSAFEVQSPQGDGHVEDRQPQPWLSESVDAGSPPVAMQGAGSPHGRASPSPSTHRLQLQGKVEGGKGPDTSREEEVPSLVSPPGLRPAAVERGAEGAGAGAGAALAAVPPLSPDKVAAARRRLGALRAKLREARPLELRDPATGFALSRSTREPLAAVEVCVLAGRDLPALRKMSDSCDAYVVVSLLRGDGREGDGAGAQHRRYQPRDAATRAQATPVAGGGRYPQWDTYLELRPVRLPGEALRFEARHRDPDPEKHVVIGRAELSLRALSDQRKHALWLPLRPPPPEEGARRVRHLSPLCALRVQVRFGFSRTAALEDRISQLERQLTLYNDPATNGTEAATPPLSRKRSYRDKQLPYWKRPGFAQSSLPFSNTTVDSLAHSEGPSRPHLQSQQWDVLDTRGSSSSEEMGSAWQGGGEAKDLASHHGRSLAPTAHSEAEGGGEGEAAALRQQLKEQRARADTLAAQKAEAQGALEREQLRRQLEEQRARADALEVELKSVGTATAVATGDGGKRELWRLEREHAQSPKQTRDNHLEGAGPVVPTVTKAKAAKKEVADTTDYDTGLDEAQQEEELIIDVPVVLPSAGMAAGPSDLQEVKKTTGAAEPQTNNSISFSLEDSQIMPHQSQYMQASELLDQSSQQNIGRTIKGIQEALPQKSPSQQQPPIKKKHKISTNNKPSTAAAAAPKANLSIFKSPGWKYRTGQRGPGGGAREGRPQLDNQSLEFQRRMYRHLGY